ncbi:MAG: Ig-like domain-containing protein [Nanoarchaeota archaeon]
MKYALLTIVMTILLASTAAASVYINEFVPYPNAGQDWVELFNDGASSVPLAGWVINTTAGSFALSGAVTSGGFLAFDINNLLDNSADNIKLINGVDTIVHSQVYAQATQGKSWGLKKDGVDGGTDNSWIQYTTPTKGQTNEQAPVWNSQPVVPDFDEDTTREVTLDVIDPNGDALSFSATAGHVSVTFNSNVATLNPAANYYGDDIITFTARDGTADVDSNAILFTINPVNDAPTFSTSPVTTATIDQAYSYDANANDMEGNIITFSLVQSPVGMVIDANTGLVQWTPNATGSFGVTVKASDGNGGNTEQAYTINVKDSSKLNIKDFDVKVDGKSHNGIDNGDTISRDAEPGSTVKFKINVESIFDRDVDEEDIEIQDIIVTATIYDIDDGDDLEEESDEFDLKPGRDETVDFTFDVPKFVDEGSYDIGILIEGTDEDGNDHVVEWTIYLEVNKQTHALFIEDEQFSPNIISCNRITELNFNVVNLGSEDEDEVTVTVESNDLGIDFKEEEIELDSGSDQDDSTYSKSLTVDARGLESGVYSATIRAYYNDDRLEDTKTVQLQVSSCTTDSGDDDTAPPPPPVDNGDDETDDNLQVDYIPVPPLTGGVTSGPDTTQETAFSSGTMYLTLLGIVAVILLIVIIIAIATMGRRR